MVFHEVIGLKQSWHRTISQISWSMHRCVSCIDSKIAFYSVLWSGPSSTSPSQQAKHEFGTKRHLVTSTRLHSRAVDGPLFPFFISIATKFSCLLILYTLHPTPVTVAVYLNYDARPYVIQAPSETLRKGPWSTGPGTKDQPQFSIPKEDLKIRLAFSEGSSSSKEVLVTKEYDSFISVKRDMELHWEKEKETDRRATCEYSSFFVRSS